MGIVHFVCGIRSFSGIISTFPLIHLTAAICVTTLVMDDTSGNALPSPSEESVPSRIPTPMSTVEGPEGYQFPRSRVRKVMRDSSKTPLFLVGFGAFSPITFLHLRIFEQTADYVKDRDFELIGGTISPVNDGYNKAGMASGQHRLAMCSLAAEQTSDWLMVDDYEIRQLDYTPTALVLNHVDHEINTVMGGVETSTGAKKEVHIGMVCGADLLDSMRHPGVWAEDDLRHIFDNFSVFCVERMGTGKRSYFSSRMRLDDWRRS